MAFTDSHIDELLTAWPGLRRIPSRDAGVAVICGWLDFSVTPPGLPTIIDRYRIRLEVPLAGSRALPVAFERGERIAATSSNHINPSGSLCLGSPLQLQLKLGSSPSLLLYVEQCLVPFLYAASWRAQGNAGFPFDELAHGAQGLVEDYQRLLQLNRAEHIDDALRLLSTRKRKANKRPCACGCGLRLGRCAYRYHLSSLRTLLPRRAYRDARLYFQYQLSLDMRVSPEEQVNRLAIERRSYTRESRLHKCTACQVTKPSVGTNATVMAVMEAK